MRNEAATASIIELTQALVRCRSCVGTDSCTAVVWLMKDWLEAKGVSCEILYSRLNAECVGVAAECESGVPGRILCLNACLDTAPVGDLEKWHVPAFNGEVRDGRLYGRGAADSKVGAAIFAHVFLQYSTGSRHLAKGKLHLIFDGDEHSGSFQGVKSYLHRFSRPDVVAIGYPGNKVINCGARGFLRLVIKVHGIASHSGGKSQDQQNAITNATKLIEELQSKRLPAGVAPFDFGPKMTVTSIRGGEGYSIVPDLCEFNIDFRLTPTFNRHAAMAHVDHALDQFRLRCAEAYPMVSMVGEVPAYSIEEGEPFVECLTEAAREVWGRSIPTGVCGPSNIGNVLAQEGIPAICGFGVDYAGCHASDEFVTVNSIGPTFEVYQTAVKKYLLEPEAKSKSRH